MEVVVALSVGVAAPTATKTGILLLPRSHYRSLSSSRGACASLIATSCGRRNFSQGIASHRRGNRTCRISCSQVRLEDIDDDACELVNGAELILGDGIDTFRAYLFTAVKNNNGTGILLLSDVHGFEASSTRDFAYRVACNGYNVLVPDLFRGSPWDKNRPRSEFDDWVAKHPFKRVSKDMSTAAKWMSDEFEAAGIHKKLAMVGFCFGGGCLIQALARDQGAYISTAVCFYGTHMDPSVAANITIPILFIAGDNDPLCSISEMQDLAKSIGRGSNVVVFKDRGHAFVHRPGSPEEDSDAEQAFVVMRNWLHDGLGVFINVPWWYLAFNRMISPFLTQRTKSKFVFAGPSKSAEILFKYIAPEQVPIQYGGLNKEGDQEFSTADAVTEVTIRPTTKQTVEFPASETCALVWEVRVVGWDVSYGAEFVPTAEDGYTVIVQKSRKISPSDEPVICNSFKIGEQGKVVLTFDNTTSKKKKLLFRSKTKPSSE